MQVNRTSVFTVSAMVRWADTGLVIDDTMSDIRLSATASQWTANPATGLVGPRGNPAYTARPGYSLPGDKEGLLVGKVGDALFVVGQGTGVAPGVTGRLYLSINDDLHGEYGRGFVDNTGSIEVTISLTATVAEPVRRPRPRAVSL